METYLHGKSGLLTIAYLSVAWAAEAAYSCAAGAAAVGVGEGVEGGRGWKGGLDKVCLCVLIWSAVAGSGAGATTCAA